MAASYYNDVRQRSTVEVSGGGGVGTEIPDGARRRTEVAMILVDTALQKREAEGKPIRVGIVGAGFMAHGLTNQIVNSVPGMRVVAISNRKPARAMETFQYAGLEPVTADSQRAFDQAVEAGRPVATEDAMLLARSPHVDVLVETTGSVEFGAR